MPLHEPGLGPFYAVGPRKKTLVKNGKKCFLQLRVEEADSTGRVVRYTEIRGSLMNDPDITRKVKHRIQVASQVVSHNQDQGRQA
jgi:hypothetical protein